jgi:hypothetical protein
VPLPCARTVFPARGATVPPRRGVLASGLPAGLSGAVYSEQCGAPPSAKQGKRAEAYELLALIYGWFTEGFDTADLQEAKALLEALG